MGMIGNQLAPGTQFAVTNDSYNGDGSTTAFTLSQSVSATTDIEVIVDNVQQSPHDGSYSVSGTALTFSGAPSAGTNNIYVIYHGSKHHTTAQVIPDDGSVTHSKLHTNALDPLNLDPTNNRVGINTTNGPESLNTTGNIRFQTNNTVRLEYLNSTGAYVTGTTGGAAVGFEYQTGGADHEIFFETHNGGVSHREVMRIDKDGYLRKPYQPAFRVGKTTGQSGSGGSFIDPISFQQTDFNIGNHFSTSTSKFTAPVAGRYIFNWSVSINRNSASYTGVYSYVNGSYLDWTNSFQYSAPSWFPHDASIIVNLAANDTFHIVGRQDSNASIDNSGWFAGYLLG